MELKVSKYKKSYILRKFEFLGLNVIISKLKLENKYYKIVKKYVNLWL